jgi:hypothetical protein
MSDNRATGQNTGGKTPLGEFLEHQRRSAEETLKALNALVPPDFRTHSREARKEFLLSFKVLIDGAAGAVERELNRMRTSKTSTPDAAPNSSPSDEPPVSSTGKTKVKIEVS